MALFGDTPARHLQSPRPHQACKRVLGAIPPVPNNFATEYDLLDVAESSSYSNDHPQAAVIPVSLITSAADNG